MPHPELFRHTALSDPEDEIRLLKIVQPSKPPISSMSCVLTTWPIRSAPAYHAISYTWGDANAVRQITVNGNRASVTENCFYALSQAISAAPGGGGGGCYFWVDSVCINQHDAAEKSRQVKMMGSIYQNAASVLACVGESADDSPMLFGILNRRAADLIRCSKTWREKHRVDRLFRQARIGRNLGLGSATQQGDLIAAFKSFFERPYFARVWVMQLFMGETISVCCGQDVAPFQALDGLRVLVCQLIFRQDFPGLWADANLASRAFKSPRYRRGMAQLSNLLRGNKFAQNHMEVATRSKSHLLPLGQAASMTFGLECSDPRDRIYALLALVDWGGLRPVEPDYNISEFDLALQTLYKLSELELVKSSPLFYDPRVQLIPALGLSAQTLDIAEAIRQRQRPEDEACSRAWTSTEVTPRLKKHSMFWLAWYIVYDEPRGWRLQFERPAPSGPPVDETARHKTRPEIHTSLRGTAASVLLPPCAQRGDVHLIQGRFTASLGSQEYLGLVARPGDNTGEPSRRPIVGKAIVQGPLAAVMGPSDNNLGFVFFDPEDLVVLTAAEQQYPSWEEASSADRELYLKTRVCKTPGSSYAIAGPRNEMRKLFQEEEERLFRDGPDDISSKRAGEAKSTMRERFWSVQVQLSIAVNRLRWSLYRFMSRRNV